MWTTVAMAKPSHVSFTVGAKHEHSDLTSTANPLNRYPHLKFGFFANSNVANDNVTAASSKICKPTTSSSAPTESPAPQSEPPTFAAATNLDTAPTLSETPESHLEHPTKRSPDMAEPPTKRAKRTDSAAMWERTSRPTDTKDKPRDPPRDTRHKDDRDRKHEDGRKHGREDRIRRSRSRSWDRRRDRDGERRRDRSRSRDRKGTRPMNGSYSPQRERDGKRRRDEGRRDRDRSVSRERHRSRRGKLNTPCTAFSSSSLSSSTYPLSYCLYPQYSLYIYPSQPIARSAAHSRASYYAPLLAAKANP